MLRKRLNKSKHRTFKITLLILLSMIVLGIFLFFYMGYNVKYDLRVQIDSLLASHTEKHLRKLSAISVNRETFCFLKNSPNSKIRDLSDFQGNLGDSSDGYYTGSINGRTTSIIMTKENYHWQLTSIQIYKK
ncbi:hypothetical protein [Lentilactobacillus hilgardii]|uniref:hypothetical protein n=1 Tax=Lentilactobacillus hilgardii TaxID=1588 RepID=UPI0039EB5FA6